MISSSLHDLDQSFQMRSKENPRPLEISAFPSPPANRECERRAAILRSEFTHREEVFGALGGIHRLVGGAEQHSDAGGGTRVNADSHRCADFDVLDLLGELLE